MKIKTVKTDELAGDEFDYALLKAISENMDDIHLTECGVQRVDVLLRYGETKFYRVTSFCPSAAMAIEGQSNREKAISDIKASFGETVEIPVDREPCYFLGHKNGHRCPLIPRER